MLSELRIERFPEHLLLGSICARGQVRQRLNLLFIQVQCYLRAFCASAHLLILAC